MKVISLKAENVKRLEAVEITPNGDVQIIGGDNSNGKTSVLDAIWLALGGADASKSVKTPVRKGQDSAFVTLDLGDYIVTREWANDKSKLTVSAANGAKFAQPQGLLDSLLGAHTFDPLAFIRLEPKKQLEALLALVHLDINLEANAVSRKVAYDERTEWNRKAKELDSQLIGLGNAFLDAPAEIVTSQEILLEIEKQYQIKDKWNANRERLENADEKVLLLQQQLKAAEAERAILLENPVEVPDLQLITSLQGRLADVEETNNKIRHNKLRFETVFKLAEAQAHAEDLSGDIEALDLEKTTSLAKAKFPVPGLGFTEDGVTYNDLPLADASESEKIRVSLGMAMALNPQIRVIRINDGSLLDKKNLALITEMAKEKDFQVWIETVGDNGVGVIIEDGKVLKNYAEAE